MIKASSLDHVALWVANRDAISDFACRYLGMHEIERSEDFTLLGVAAREGKLTLFDAEAPRERGALESIALRVHDLDDALSALPAETVVRRDGNRVRFDVSDEVPIELIQADGIDHDLDHVVLAVADPDATAARLGLLGFERNDGALVVGGRYVQLKPGGRSEEPARPLLNHLALLVDSAEKAREDAESEGFEIAKFVDAENTLAAFVSGPGGIQVELVEHKPSFSLT